jgi:hypothetical protein
MAFQEQTREVLVYTPNDNPWCNTLAVVGWDTFQRSLISVPRGIGLSLVFDWLTVKLPLKSKYVLLPSKLLAEIRQTRSHEIYETDFKPLVETSLGVLYLNLASQCTSEQ